MKIQGAGEMLGLHGTMFRLPFRTAKTAKVSEISQECIGPGEVSDLLEKVAAMATELILFTKWVKEISVYVVNGDGGVSCQMFTKVHCTQMANLGEWRHSTVDVMHILNFTYWASSTEVESTCLQ